MVVHDIDRPDVGGVPPKMQAIAEQVKEALAGLVPYLTVGTNDNLMSSVSIRGSFDARETWTNGIWENSRNFRFSIVPMNGKRYYDAADDKVTVELEQGRRVGKFRKSTATVAKVIERIKAFIEAGK